ncbi:hypothetical protein, partial [Bradyrhizobium elkanii]|uniref:hypothetical protein n=2 Tax=Nitrobacteraceae TaxID=41294 RepID=UPI001AEC1DFA
AVGTAALSIVPAAAVPSVMAPDATKISRELRDLIPGLIAADETLMATQAVYDAEYRLYQAWEDRKPGPTVITGGLGVNGPGTQKKYLRGSQAHREARKAIAEYRARDMNEVVQKGC